MAFAQILLQQGSALLLQSGSALLLQASDPDPPVDLAAAVAARLDARVVALAGAATWAGAGPAPPETPLPYLDVREPGEGGEASDSSGGRIARGHLEVHCYAANRDAARRLGDRAEAALLAPPGLAFSAGAIMKLLRSSRSMRLDPDPAPGGGECWEELRLFEFEYSYQN